MLEIPLVVVLGHDRCGAIGAALHAHALLTEEHVRHTAHLLAERSGVLGGRVDSGASPAANVTGRVTRR